MNWKTFAALFTGVWAIAWCVVNIVGFESVPSATNSWNFAIVFAAITLIGLPIAFFASMPICSWAADLQKRRSKQLSTKEKAGL